MKLAGNADGIDGVGSLRLKEVTLTLILEWQETLELVPPFIISSLGNGQRCLCSPNSVMERTGLDQHLSKREGVSRYLKKIFGIVFDGCRPGIK